MSNTDTMVKRKRTALSKGNKSSLALRQNLQLFVDYSTY